MWGALRGGGRVRGRMLQCNSTRACSAMDGVPNSIAGTRHARSAAGEHCPQYQHADSICLSNRWPVVYLNYEISLLLMFVEKNYSWGGVSPQQRASYSRRRMRQNESTGESCSKTTCYNCNHFLLTQINNGVRTLCLPLSGGQPRDLRWKRSCGGPSSR